MSEHNRPCAAEAGAQPDIPGAQSLPQLPETHAEERPVEGADAPVTPEAAALPVKAVSEFIPSVTQPEEPAESAPPIADAAEAVADIASDAARDASAAPAESQATESSTPAEPAAPVKPVPPSRSEIDAEFVAKAADPGEYELQEHDTFTLPAGASVDVYAACRIGLGHIGKDMPCQDSCTYRKISHGVALLDADGVSACDQSQYGSRRACEIAAEQIEQLSLRHVSEKDFIRELCSDDFYAGIREAWVADMKQHWLTLPSRNEKENPLLHYGTTLLIAVVTDNWYVAMNLGDGQILLFSEDECMRIQLVDKETQAPSCLVYDTYLEDVRRGVWPRKHFKGIALMTDGMNDRLAKLPWKAPHDYIVQTARRFTEHQAPYQPFIYSGKIGGEDRTYDVSRQRSANDDFSFVLALCRDYLGYEAAAIRRELESRYPGADLLMLQRRIGRRAGYLVADKTAFSFVIVTPEEMPRLLRDPRLTHFRNGAVQLWTPEKLWTKDGRTYAQYSLPASRPSQFIEEAVQGFAFKTADQYHKVPDEYDPVTNEKVRIVEPLIGEPIVRMHHTLTDLQSHLAAQSMRLNEAAMHWILHVPGPEDTLLIPEEVMDETDSPAANLPWVWNPAALSPAMFGYLSCDGRLMPVFGHRTSMANSYCYFFGAPNRPEARHRFFSVAYNSKTHAYGLQNASQCSWALTAPDGMTTEVAPGKTVGFAEGRTLTVAPPGLPEFTCTMHVL